jgi:hypothetical protein
MIDVPMLFAASLAQSRARVLAKIEGLDARDGLGHAGSPGERTVGCRGGKGGQAW